MKGKVSVNIVEREFFTSEILRWGKANFRSFPWREPGTTGYQILVSEVLLRKTRAESIVPKIMKDSNLCIILINGHDLKLIKDNQAAIVDIFNREAQNAMKLKALEI